MQRFIIPFKTSDQKQKCLQIKSKSSLFKKRAVKTWTRQQDQRLIALYNQYPKKWNLIAENMHNRNENQCLHRFRRICQLGQNKKIWSVQEDQTVLKMIAKIGHNWKLIAQELGTKNGKQIRQRFINKLDPTIRRQQWAQEQDLKIIQLYSKLGSKWCEISKSLPGRPQNRIKNRFYSYIQKNYQFKVKEKSDQKFQNKQNVIQKGVVKNIQKKENQNIQLLKKPKSLNIFEQNFSYFNHQGAKLISNHKISGNEIKQQVYDSEEQQVCQQMSNVKQQNQMNQFQSMKQINDQCFFKYDGNNNNNELLYFQDA